MSGRTPHRQWRTARLPARIAITGPFAGGVSASGRGAGQASLLTARLTTGANPGGVLRQRRRPDQRVLGRPRNAQGGLGTPAGQMGQGPSAAACNQGRTRPPRAPVRSFPWGMVRQRGSGNRRRQCSDVYVNNIGTSRAGQTPLPTSE